MKVIQKHFNSITELNKYLSESEAQPNFKGCESSLREEKENGSFYKTKTYEDANNLLLHGDKKLAKEIEDAGVAKTRLKLKTQQTRRQLFSAVVGVAPNVPNALAGVPTSMISVKEIRCKTKVVNIFYNLSVCGVVGADEIIRKSSKFISACMLLEAQGIRLNVYAGDVANKGNDYTIFSTRIKSASQPFDVLKMAYPLAHPSMLRRHYFRAMEVTKGVNKSFVYGYGRVISDTDLINKLLDTKVKFNCILSFNHINDEMTAEDVAKEIINRCK